MSSPKIFVLGGSGPAGLCLLRELLFRKHPTVAYVRNPTKIPSDLTSSPLLTVVKGEMDDLASFTAALSGCTTIISLLGPDIAHPNISPTLYSDMFKNTIFPGMRANGTKRLFAMGTISITRPEDSWTLMTPLVLAYVKLFARALYKNLMNIVDLLETEGRDLDWTVFRIAAIPGEADEESWRKGREEGEVYVGPLGAKGWTSSTNRSRLARWLVDAAESGAAEWVRKMPAVTRLAGS
ncbi:NmrA family protein [Stagonosporopsis vannaccii]|nr:NmrA family protein [Stagonosporopsis vannaccii]